VGHAPLVLPHRPLLEAWHPNLAVELGQAGAGGIEVLGGQTVGRSDGQAKQDDDQDLGEGVHEAVARDCVQFYP
jgi:hypothetical protein